MCRRVGAYPHVLARRHRPRTHHLSGLQGRRGARRGRRRDHLAILSRRRRKTRWQRVGHRRASPACRSQYLTLAKRRSTRRAAGAARAHVGGAAAVLVSASCSRAAAQSFISTRRRAPLRDGGDGAPAVEDTSTNGVWLNGQKVGKGNSRPLRHADALAREAGRDRGGRAPLPLHRALSAAAPPPRRRRPRRRRRATRRRRRWRATTTTAAAAARSRPPSRGGGGGARRGGGGGRDRRRRRRREALHVRDLPGHRLPAGGGAAVPPLVLRRLLRRVDADAPLRRPECRQRVQFVSRNHGLKSLVDDFLAKHPAKARDAAERAPRRDRHAGQRAAPRRQARAATAATTTTTSTTTTTARARSWGRARNRSRTTAASRSCKMCSKSSRRAARCRRASAVARRPGRRRLRHRGVRVLHPPLPAGRRQVAGGAPAADRAGGERLRGAGAPERARAADPRRFPRGAGPRRGGAPPRVPPARRGRRARPRAPVVPARALTPATRLCEGCATTIFATLAYAYRAAIPPAQLPPAVTARSNCWYGRQCRTQRHNAAHAERLNHVCEADPSHGRRGGGGGGAGAAGSAAGGAVGA